MARTHRKDDRTRLRLSLALAAIVAAGVVVGCSSLVRPTPCPYTTGT